MAISISTDLRNALLSGASLKSTLDGGWVKIYAGTVPADADAALGGATLLCTISISGGGTGINFDTTASSGQLAKAPAESWQGTNAATGTATFYRHVESTDDGGANTGDGTRARIQGTISTAGADMNLTSTSLSSGATQTIDYYVVTLPAS